MVRGLWLGTVVFGWWLEFDRSDESDVDYKRQILVQDSQKGDTHFYLSIKIILKFLANDYTIGTLKHQ